MKILILGAQRRLPFIYEEEQPQEDNRLGKGVVYEYISYKISTRR